MMDVIKSPDSSPEDATRYWGQYYVETPMCNIAGCGRVAHEVDAFFPYIDDLNRCDEHPGQSEPSTVH